MDMPAGVGSPDETLLVVAVLSCNRPESLDRLLSAFGELEMPPATKVVFLVVNNKATSAAHAVFKKHHGGLPKLNYVEELTPGIPFARNRAVDEALALGADALCFIDDDEVPDRSWLREFVGCWRETGAEMVGGPVRVSEPSSKVSLWKRLINSSLISRQTRKNRKTERAVLNGKKFTIVTNNWFCDFSWLTRSGIRFDETLQFSGGSDTAFFRQAREIECKAAWCPSAIVWETLDEDRLSIRYQFHRARCQSINHFRMNHPCVSVGTVVATVAIATLRTCTGLLLIVFPVMGVASLTVGIRSIGWSVGRLQSLFGKESRLYG